MSTLAREGHVALILGRRELIAALSSAAAWPLAARAQQRAMPVVGYLGGASPELYADRLRVFHQGLNETGYVEQRNVANRISLGGQPFRSTAGLGIGSGSPTGGGDRRSWQHPRGTRGKGRDHDDSNRLRNRVRPS
jgi:hypothetical protein